MRARDLRARFIRSYENTNHGWLHLFLGGMVGIAAPTLIFGLLTNGIILPLCRIFHYYSDVFYCYGSWILTMSVVYFIFISLRRRFPLFAGAFIFLAVLASLPLLFILAMVVSIGSSP